MPKNKILLIGGGLVGAVALGVVALIVVFALRSDDPNLKTEAPAISTSVGASAGTPGTSDANLPAGVLHFVVDPAGSEAKYVVREKLARLPISSDAVGTTNAVSGDFYLTKEGLYKDRATKLTVDLSKLKTDESLRDNFVRNSTLQTSRFPNAEFIAESVTPWPANYTDGTEVALTLSGTLTLHGVSKKVEWKVKARRAGNALTGIADIDFLMSDFNITPPDIPNVAKAENGVHLQITIAAKTAS